MLRALNFELVGKKKAWIIENDREGRWLNR